jgi:hypothetical protein
MDDDIFADLTGLARPKPPPVPVPAIETPLPMKAGPSSGPLLPDPAHMASDLSSPANGATSRQEGMTVAVSKQELEDMVREAVEATLAKFVKSIKTVLEDMGRRIEATGGRGCA